MRKNSTPLPILMNTEQFDAKVVAKNFGIVIKTLIDMIVQQIDFTEAYERTTEFPTKRH